MMVPVQQRYGGLLKIVARSSAGSGNPIELVRRQVQALDANMPVFDAQTLNEHMRLPLFPARIAATMFGTFGSLALLLAAVGIFGVVSFTVSRRTQEIGLRMALGADRRSVLRLIVWQGMLPVVVGLAAGLVGTLVLAPIIEIDAVLYGVSSTDSLTFGLITALLASVSLVACYLPARRALRVDPVIALRHI
jgi:ABC-type antimicrobial peptide transport system permease subunit